MLKQEFDLLTGSNVSGEAYKTVEAIYMASKMKKNEFCKAWKDLTPIALELVKDLARSVRLYRDKCEAQKAIAESVGKRLLESAHMAHRADGDRDTLRVLSGQLLGRKAYIKESLEKGYSLTDEDRQYLLDLMDHE